MSDAALRIIFAGSGEFGLPTLRALKDQIVQVVSQPDRPAGRGRGVTPTPVSQFAELVQLPLIKTSDINSQTLADADLMVVIAFGQKIAPHIVDHPRRGSVNLHASRLPRYRGAAPINWAIIRGERVTGNSIIRLAQKMDAGAILAQSQVPIGDLETAGELHDRLAGDGAALMLSALSGDFVETPQDESQATLAPKLSRESSRIDWTRPAADIANQIRGMYPWPGCHVRIGETGNEVTLVRARARHATPPFGSEPQGRRQAAGVIADDGTVSGVEIVELQPRGKRPMSLAAYRNGHPWEAGMTLISI